MIKPSAAAWSLNHWDAMDDYITVMKIDSLDRAFYRAVLCVHRNQFPKAFQHINKARNLLDGELTIGRLRSAILGCAGTRRSHSTALTALTTSLIH